MIATLSRELKNKDLSLSNLIIENILNYFLPQPSQLFPQSMRFDAFTLSTAVEDWTKPEAWAKHSAAAGLESGGWAIDILADRCRRVDPARFRPISRSWGQVASGGRAQRDPLLWQDLDVGNNQKGKSLSVSWSAAEPNSFTVVIKKKIDMIGTRSNPQL